jgi:hypothetical protein
MIDTLDTGSTGAHTAPEAQIDTLLVGKADIGQLTAIEADIDSLTARTATIESAYIDEADVHTLLVSGTATFMGTIFATDGEFSGTITAGAIVAAANFTAPSSQFNSIVCGQLIGDYIRLWDGPSLGTYISGSQFQTHTISGHAISVSDATVVNLNGVAITGLYKDSNGFLKVT